jgi:hypothetical protein
VLQDKVFIGKLGTIDRFSTGTVVIGEITPLAHEARNDAVETGSLVSKAMFPRAQGTEVLRSLRDDIGTQLHHDASRGTAADRDIEVDLRFRPKNVLQQINSPVNKRVSQEAQERSQSKHKMTDGVQY